MVWCYNGAMETNTPTVDIMPILERVDALRQERALPAMSLMLTLIRAMHKRGIAVETEKCQCSGRNDGQDDPVFDIHDYALSYQGTLYDLAGPTTRERIQEKLPKTAGKLGWGAASRHEYEWTMLAGAPDEVRQWLDRDKVAMELGRIIEEELARQSHRAIARNTLSIERRGPGSRRI